MDIQEYPLIDELKLNIKPHEELWKLQEEFETKFNKAWKNGPYKKLVPDDVESDHK